MLKNKFKIIAFFMLIILSITIPVVMAENESTVDAINESGENTIENSTETTQIDIKNSDVYLTGDDITVDYVVDGNLFVFADNVTIDSQIGGDAFIFANNVTVTQNGYIFSNLFTFATNINIQGIVYDVYAVSQDLTISGYIYRDVKATCDNLNVNGVIARDAFVACSNIAFSQPNATTNEDSSVISTTGVINGNLNYSSSNELSIPDGSVVGEISFSQTNVSGTNTIEDYLLNLGTIAANVIVIWLLCLWIAPRFLEKSSTLVSKKLLPVIGIGILTPFAFVLAATFLIIFKLTTTFGLLSLGLLTLLMGISTSVFIISITNLICNKLNIEKRIMIFGMLIASSIVLWLVSLIPYLGPIVGFIAIIIGLGIIVSNLILKDKVKDSNKDTHVS